MAILEVKSPKNIPDEYIRRYALKMIDEMIVKFLSQSEPKSQIHQLFADNSLSYKIQKSLLKGIILSTSDILWLNKEAQELGYLLDVFHEEVYPKKYNEKRKPIVYYQEDDREIDALGSTDMPYGEMRALLEQRKVVQARIYHKDNFWHCFYYTGKGISGNEKVFWGAKPHYHYVSDKSGITLDDFMVCDMPSSNVHIIIDKE